MLYPWVTSWSHLLVLLADGSHPQLLARALGQDAGAALQLIILQSLLPKGACKLPPLMVLLAAGLQMAATRSSLPVPLGRTQVARSCWSLYLGSMFRLACTSTVSVNFREAVCFSSSRACLGPSGLSLPANSERAPQQMALLYYLQ